MQEYNEYVTAVNKVFDYLEKMKAGWNSMDNSNYIENIEEYKQIAIENAAKFKTAKQAPPQNNTSNITSLDDTTVLESLDDSNEGLEALGDD